MMRVDHIRLRAITSARRLGVDIPLREGLNILRAENTSGKSTCLMAVLYGLGLERALGPQIRVPLPYAMRERVQLEKDGGEYEPIHQSYVMLQLSNGGGEVVTVRRDIVGGADQRLVQTWPGSKIDDTGRSMSQKDYFVHDPGAAVGEVGFHAYLARFLGWELPVVPRFDGTECPLYMETLWPLFFVEQKRGWAETQGPFPTFLRIQDLSRRVMEFVLRLDAGELRRRKAELRREIARIEGTWAAKRSEIVAGLSAVVRVTGLPAGPTAEFSKDAEVTVSAYYNEGWIGVDEVAGRLQERREALEDAEPKGAEEAQGEIQSLLSAKEQRHAELSAEGALIRKEFDSAVGERASVEKRLDSLRVDLKRNLDTQKLRRLGSKIGDFVVDNTCPTCHQMVEGELLPENGVTVMGLEENIGFVRSQLALYEGIRDRTEDAVSSMRARYSGVQNELADVRAAIRGLKNDLVRPADAVVWSGIEELVRLEGQLDQWKAVEERVDGVVDEMRQLATQWVAMKEEYRDIGAGDLSEEDEAKVGRLEEISRELLGLFGFLSFGPEEIALAEDDYRPRVVERDERGERFEKNIGFEVSASDGIRLKWSYYLALLKVAEEFGSNHLGFLVFDEPGQQQMRDVDLGKFLKWTATSLGEGTQVIVSTSEDLRTVRSYVEGTGATVHEFEGFMIREVDW